MAGHGSPPPADKAQHPSRKIAPESWKTSTGSFEGWSSSPPADMSNVVRAQLGATHRDPVTLQGPDFSGDPFAYRTVKVKTARRVQIAADGLLRRGAEGRDIYTGKK